MRVSAQMPHPVFQTHRKCLQPCWLPPGQHLESWKHPGGRNSILRLHAVIDHPEELMFLHISTVHDLRGHLCLETNIDVFMSIYFILSREQNKTYYMSNT